MSLPVKDTSIPHSLLLPYLHVSHLIYNIPVILSVQLVVFLAVWK